jgi:hypothetical protein
METMLRQEIKTLCEDIAANSEQGTFDYLIEQIEALQEKLMVVAYLEKRELRFSERTKQLKKQLTSAVADRPLRKPADIPEVAPEPQLEEPEAIQEEGLIEVPISSTPIKEPEPEVDHEILDETTSPSDSKVPDFDEKPKPIQASLFDEEGEEEEVPQAPKSQAQSLSANHFVPNPDPVITAKPSTKSAAAPKTTPATVPNENAKAAVATSIAEKLTKPKTSLNDRLNKKAINIGLNDRLAFVKHLFAGSQEDFNRVISQLNTQTSHQEAVNFVEQFVKPDYDWSGKELYEERLLEIIRNRFED